MGSERFTHEEATRLFSQEPDPPTAVERLQSMMAILNTWRRNGFPRMNQQEINKQLAILARGIFDAPEEERVEVNGIIRGYKRSRYQEMRAIGRRLGREIKNASRIKQPKMA
jgi:hypothetical protein